MSTELISEPITPAIDTMDTRVAATGEPDMPRRFLWRDREYTVEAVLEKWKETSRCKSGADEQYVRKHWFRIRTTDGAEMKIYFERQPASKRERKMRWWLFSLAR